MCRFNATFNGGLTMIEILLLVLLGSSLLVFAEEKEWHVYVKLALYLTVSSYILSLFA
jgi:predicted RNA-binding protein